MQTIAANSWPSRQQFAGLVTGHLFRAVEGTPEDDNENGTQMLNETQAAKLAEPVVVSDPLFNVHRYPGTRHSHLVVDHVFQAVEAYGPRRRARNREAYYRLLGTVGVVVVNLMHHYLAGSPGQGLPVPRAKKDLGRKPTRYEPHPFPRSFPKMLDALCALEFAEQSIGKYSGIPGKSKRTTIRAGRKLIELIEEHKVTLEDLRVSDRDEIVILKRPKRGYFDEGERIDYTDDVTTRRYREELRAINAWLAKADIEFDAIAAGYDLPVDAQARRLYRSFTMGRFDSGGRLFGGFWENLPKEVRLRGISIEGEHVVGLDFSQLNPLLAYSLAKAEPPSRDAYTLPGLEDRRDGVKKVFNAMLFDKKRRNKFPRGARVLFPRKVKIADVTGAIFEQHPMLKGLLSVAGIGHTLMFLESKIMMNVLRQCQKRGIVALPVFDCVVVKASTAEVVKRIMQQEFKAVAGFNGVVREEVVASDDLRTRLGSPRVHKVSEVATVSIR
jgi:hypothetical protein